MPLLSTGKFLLQPLHRLRLELSQSDPHLHLLGRFPHAMFDMWLLDLIAMTPKITSIVLAGFLLITGTACSQPEEFNYDESKVPEYELPEVLQLESGEKISKAEQWAERRQEILTLFEDQVYGRAPEAPQSLRFTVIEEDAAALGGLAHRKQVRVEFTAEDEGPYMDILLYTPVQASGKVAVFLGLNFSGNQTVHADPAIRLPLISKKDEALDDIVTAQGSEDSRGRSAGRWQLESLLDRGYGLATVYCGDLDPDIDDGFQNGVHPLSPPTAAEDWGTIAAWAWGLSRALDYLETDSQVDAGRVAVMGHSRLGKTAVWAGARDDRFAMVISNNSGCGGAALSRRRFGETVKRINTRFPHWFNTNFKKYNGMEGMLPVDQHMLLALVAPRPLYVASAVEDEWSDPQGEFLAAMHAGEVYELLGQQGLGISEQPPVDQPVMHTIGYHIRTGKHDVQAFDWEQYMDFADLHWPSM